MRGEAPVVVGARSALFLPLPTSASSSWMKSTSRPTSRKTAPLPRPRHGRGARAYRKSPSCWRRPPRRSRPTSMRARDAIADRAASPWRPEMPGIRRSIWPVPPGAASSRRKLAEHFRRRGHGANRRCCFSIVAAMRRSHYAEPAANVCRRLFRMAGRASLSPRLACHHCGFPVPRPHTCPNAAEESLVACGPGVERVQEEVASLFPDARSMVCRATSSPRSKRCAAR